MTMRDFEPEIVDLMQRLDALESQCDMYETEIALLRDEVERLNNSNRTNIDNPDK